MLIFSVLKTFGNRAALLPKAQFMTACMNIASPIVTMMTEMIGSPTSGRSITTCTRMPKRVVKTSANGERGHERQLPFHDEVPADPRAQHQEFALREIDHLGRLVDQREAHRDDAVEHPDDEPVDQQLDEQVPIHARASPARLRFEAFVLQLGYDALLGAILEMDPGIDVDIRGIGIERIDDGAVFFGDHATAHLARTGQLSVIGVELLVQQHELADALALGQRRIDAFDLACGAGHRPPAEPPDRCRS